MKRRGPNWGLGFGSGSFLIVWCLGFLANLPIDVIAMRACVAVILGALVGIMVGQMIEGLQTIRDDLVRSEQKGTQIDFTLPATEDELIMPGATSAEGRVPQAAGTPETFQPLDFKQAARQVQSMSKE